MKNLKNLRIIGIDLNESGLEHLPCNLESFCCLEEKMFD
jgi:hypothetical protein